MTKVGWQDLSIAKQSNKSVGSYNAKLSFEQHLNWLNIEITGNCNLFGNFLQQVLNSFLQMFSRIQFGLDPHRCTSGGRTPENSVFQPEGA